MADAGGEIVQRSEPLVQLSVQTDGGKERVELGDRLIGFTFEDSDNKTDKASIQIDNWDLTYFDSKLIVKGAILEGKCGDVAPLMHAVFAQTQRGGPLVGGVDHLAIVVDADDTSLYADLRRQDRGIEPGTTPGVQDQVSRLEGQQLIGTLLDRLELAIDGTKILWIYVSWIGLWIRHDILLSFVFRRRVRNTDHRPGSGAEGLW